ncbi:integrator complex subunit 15 isoform X1 [Podarcis raffonei]|uniref:integrator complex subunit 15 isoform X1 n=2 Tax=Podarcis raffonei TaxID=65483 RepID=UPI00232912D6|nr:integrator complex subunit 15 isoform X1 [Podarcis raffonei]
MAAAALGRPSWPSPAAVPVLPRRQQWPEHGGLRRLRRSCSWGGRRAKRKTMSDIRHSLLRRDALSAAKEVLYHLDIYFSSQLQNVPLPIVDKGPIELLEEFIFQVPKERNSPPKRLNSLQELQLLEIMCNYFQEQSKDSVRQILFSSLFSPQGNKTDDSRMALLGKLVSMAVAVCRVPVLECAASWLQRTPAIYCVRLAQALVDDYCSLVPGSVQTLKQIFSASPRFCCQFITSVTMLYDMSSDDLIPPPDLLEMVVSWIFEDPRLILITFLNTPIAASLPIGFLELTPLSGLIRWCVKAPLAYKRRKPPVSNGHPGGKLAKDPAAALDKGCQPLYSKLHLSVLQVLIMLQGHLTEKNLYGRLGLVPFDHVVALVEEMSRLSDELNPLNATKETELALDRLAQALQVAMASGALLCTREDLRTVCARLPHNNLLQLVISGPVQQPTHAALPPGFYPPIHTPPLGYPTHAAHPAMPAHPALPAHPVQTFIPGMAFPYRPIR